MGEMGKNKLKGEMKREKFLWLALIAVFLGIFIGTALFYMYYSFRLYT